MEKKTNNKLLIVIVVLLIALIAACVVIWIGLSDKEEPQGGVGLTIDKDAGEYVAPEAENTEPTQGVAIPGWGTITIPAGQTEVPVDFYNPDANQGLYYLTFKLDLNGEILYESGLVESGKHIQKITLSRALEAGEYDAVIHVQPYKMDEKQTPTNNADIKTTLIVK